MRNWRVNFLSVLLLQLQLAAPVLAQAPSTADGAQPREPAANSEAIPKQILKTGVNITAVGVSPNTIQLADTIGLTPVLQRIQESRARVNATAAGSLESIAARQDLTEATQKALTLIERTSLEVDFTNAEIDAEHEVYSEVLATFTNDRDKAVARTNAISFISNGALWAVCEALAIPTFKYPKLGISSGIVGIPAGVVPSIASLYTFKQINGKKIKSEVEPNMLAKLFNYPTNPDIEYPKSIWQYLHQSPADKPGAKSRLDQLIDRWVADANMPGFTDRNSRKQLDVLTASVSQRKGLSISTLTARKVMLAQLQAEIGKMKRMLLELVMVVQDEKQLSATALEPTLRPPLR